MFEFAFLGLGEVLSFFEFGLLGFTFLLGPFAVDLLGLLLLAVLVTILLSFFAILVFVIGTGLQLLLLHLFVVVLVVVLVLVRFLFQLELLLLVVVLRLLLEVLGVLGQFFGDGVEELVLLLSIVVGPHSAKVIRLNETLFAWGRRSGIRLVRPLGQRHLQDQLLVGDDPLDALADNLLFVGLFGGSALLNGRPSFLPALSVEHRLKRDEIMKELKLNLFELGGRALQAFPLEFEVLLKLIDLVLLQLMRLLF